MTRIWGHFVILGVCECVILRPQIMLSISTMMACFWLELQFNIAEKQITHNVVGMPHGNISGKASVCKRYIFKRVDWYVTRYQSL